MKDIGSIFPLYEKDLSLTKTMQESHCIGNKVYYSLCREALSVIAKQLCDTNRKVLIPAYTCDTVITPFKEQNWDCHYYPVNQKLRIDEGAVHNLIADQDFTLMVVHPYYGMDLNQTEVTLLKEVHSKGCKIVVDMTQCIFSEQRLDFVDFYVGSYRKWFSIPDGAFLETQDTSLNSYEIIGENEQFVSLQTDAMYLRGVYFHTEDEVIKNISRRLSKMADESIDANIEPHTMAAISRQLIQKENREANQQQRIKNYNFLFEHLQGSDSCKLVCNNLSEVTSAPLYFVIFVSDRTLLQAKLAKQHIYAPVLWPVVYEEVLVNEEIQHIYDTILALPIDQRYGQQDMTKIVNIIKQHYND